MRKMMLSMAAVGLLLSWASVGRAALVAHWPMEEGPSGTVAIDVIDPTNNNGTLNGTPAPAWINSDLPPIGTNWALEFDGTVAGNTHYVEAANFTGIAGDGARTIAMWCKLDDVNTGNQYMVSWGVNASGQRWTFRVHNATGQLRVEVQGDFAIANTAINDGQWHHVALVYPGGPGVVEDSIIYVDGEVDGGGSVGWSSSGGGSPAINSAGGQNVQIGSATFTGGSDRDFDGLLDDIRIYDTALSQAEIQALFNSLATQNPVPTTGAANVATNSDLQWDAGVDPSNSSQRNPNVTQYFVYLMSTTPGGDPNFLNVSPVTVNDPGSDPVTLANASLPLTLVEDLEYHWRVDQGVSNSGPGDPNTVVGNVWSFETLKSFPVIVNDPQRAAHFAGETATFTCDFTSVNAPTVSWQTPTGAQAGTVVNTGGSSYTATLEIASVGSADEGSYICSITAASQTTDSSSAALLLKEQKAHWKFEGDFTDTLGNFDLQALDPNNDPPTFVSETIDGFALDCNGLEGGGAALPGLRSDDPLGLDWFAGWTVNLWVKTDNLTQSAFSGIFHMNPGFQIDMNGDGSVRYWDGSGTLAALESDTWAMVTAAWDGDTTTIYFNGVQIGTDGSDWPLIDRFGVCVNRGLNDFFDGTVDEIMVWSYAVEQADIVQIYFDETGTAICDPVNFNPLDISGPEDTPDCLVNIHDFLPLAETWLDCTILPASECP